ncbi:MAG: metallophosphoesterase family protein [Chloroflexi bacterium]|nr:metallophosphoesterase family protein [Chloroflexota bacterium]
MIAFVSDIHGNLAALEAVVEDARGQGAQRFVCLGDVGSSACLDLLSEIRAVCVFGNWEVSGWHRYAERHRSWVRGWPPLWGEDRWVAAHASPDWPEDVDSVEAAEAYRRRHGLSWLAMFPALHRDAEARWRALAAMELRGVQIAFHGHTHVQEVWQWGADRRLVRVPSADLEVVHGSRYLVGVGSVGNPRDVYGACYALWEPPGRVRLLQVST